MIIYYQRKYIENPEGGLKMADEIKLLQEILEVSDEESANIIREILQEV